MRCFFINLDGLRIVHGHLASEIDELLPWAYANAQPLKDAA
jgi:hypothetical protein